MKNKALSYLTSTINQYQRAYEIEDSCTASNVINDLKDFETFLIDLNEDTTDNTLTLNADLRNNARAYQEDLAEKECTITTLAMNLGGLGYIEQENMMLEADNLKLNNQLTLQKTKRKELFVECCEAEIENGKYIMEIQTLNKENLELKSRLAMTSVSERTIRELKADNQFCEAICIEQREKIEKLTGPHWITD